MYSNLDLNDLDWQEGTAQRKRGTLRSCLDGILESKFWIKIISDVSWILYKCVIILYNPSPFG
jgi:hypothetical protein